MRILFGSIIIGDYCHSFWMGLAVFMIACSIKGAIEVKPSWTWPDLFWHWKKERCPIEKQVKCGR